MAGAAAGWLFGILLSPRDPQKEQFQQYLKTISSIITGFALAKVGDIFDIFVKSKTVPNNVVSIRIMLVVVALFVASGWQFTTREGDKNYRAQLGKGN
jgi:hypothetical protein